MASQDTCPVYEKQTKNQKVYDDLTKPTRFGCLKPRLKAQGSERLTTQIILVFRDAKFFFRTYVKDNVLELSEPGCGEWFATDLELHGLGAAVNAYDVLHF